MPLLPEMELAETEKALLPLMQACIGKAVTIRLEDTVNEQKLQIQTLQAALKTFQSQFDDLRKTNEELRTTINEHHVVFSELRKTNTQLIQMNHKTGMTEIEKVSKQVEEISKHIDDVVTQRLQPQVGLLQYRVDKNSDTLKSLATLEGDLQQQLQPLEARVSTVEFEQKNLEEALEQLAAAHRFQGLPQEREEDFDIEQEAQVQQSRSTATILGHRRGREDSEQQMPQTNKRRRMQEPVSELDQDRDDQQEQEQPSHAVIATIGGHRLGSDAAFEVPESPPPPPPPPAQRQTAEEAPEQAPEHAPAKVPDPRYLVVKEHWASMRAKYKASPPKKGHREFIWQFIEKCKDKDFSGWIQEHLHRTLPHLVSLAKKPPRTRGDRLIALDVKMRWEDVREAMKSAEWPFSPSIPEE